MWRGHGSWIRAILAGLLLPGGPVVLWAQTAVPSGGEDAVLEALVAEALAHNPDVLAAEQALAAARQRPAQARGLRDPMFSVGYTNDGWSPSLGQREMTTLSFMASQELPFPGKRPLRGEIAARAAEQVAQQLARVRLRVEADVRRAYAGLRLARELAELTGEQRQVWREIEGVVRARYAVGQGAQQDVLRVQVEITRVEQGEIEQRAEAEIRLAELNRWLARALDTPLEVGAAGGWRPIGVSLAEALARAREVSPELASGRLAIERDQLSARLARRDYNPDFSFQAGYMNRGGLEAMWQAGVGVTLPLQRQRRASAVAESEAATLAATRGLESIDLQLRYRTQERFTRLVSTEKILALYDQGILPQDQMAVEAALANYRTGKVPFLAVLEAQATLFADRRLQVRLAADHERLKADLTEASLDPTATMAGTADVASVAGSATGGMGER
jgi:cobalt-zinc-cadmium efflux system outer membrane protein